jgi:hypothetical protein
MTIASADLNKATIFSEAVPFAEPAATTTSIKHTSHMKMKGHT